MDPETDTAVAFSMNGARDNKMIKSVYSTAHHIVKEARVLERSATVQQHVHEAGSELRPCRHTIPCTVVRSDITIPDQVKQSSGRCHGTTVVISCRNFPPLNSQTSTANGLHADNAGKLET